MGEALGLKTEHVEQAEAVEAFASGIAQLLSEPEVLKEALEAGLERIRADFLEHARSLNGGFAPNTLIGRLLFLLDVPLEYAYFPNQPVRLSRGQTQDSPVVSDMLADEETNELVLLEEAPCDAAVLDANEQASELPEDSAEESAAFEEERRLTQVLRGALWPLRAFVESGLQHQVKAGWLRYEAVSSAIDVRTRAATPQYSLSPRALAGDPPDSTWSPPRLDFAEPSPDVELAVVRLCALTVQWAGVAGSELRLTEGRKMARVIGHPRGVSRFSSNWLAWLLVFKKRRFVTLSDERAIKQMKRFIGFLDPYGVEVVRMSWPQGATGTGVANARPSKSRSQSRRADGEERP